VTAVALALGTDGNGRVVCNSYSPTWRLASPSPCPTARTRAKAVLAEFTARSEPDH